MLSNTELRGSQLTRLQNQMTRLRDENRKYREANRAAEFEAAAKQLREQLATTEADKVKALQEVHELKMKLRKNDGEFTSDGKRCAWVPPVHRDSAGPHGTLMILWSWPCIWGL